MSQIYRQAAGLQRPGTRRCGGRTPWGYVPRAPTHNLALHRLEQRLELLLPADIFGHDDARAVRTPDLVRGREQQRPDGAGRLERDELSSARRRAGAEQARSSSGLALTMMYVPRATAPAVAAFALTPKEMAPPMTDPEFRMPAWRQPDARANKSRLGGLG